jgi:malate dehydrogenase
MVKSILLNENKILSCCVHLNGEYGLKDIYCGVPVRLSQNGVEEIVKIDLTKDELASLKKSSDAVRQNIKKLNL